MFERATVPTSSVKSPSKTLEPGSKCCSRAYWAHNNEEHLRLTLEFKRIYRFRMSMWHDAVAHVQPTRAFNTHSQHEISASVVRKAGIRYSRRAQVELCILIGGSRSARETS
jgi:hypothetical protein